MSDYLFAHPTFLSGAARVMDLAGVFDAYNERETPEEADGTAIRTDWLAVGEDLRLALKTAGEEEKLPSE